MNGPRQASLRRDYWQTPGFAIERGDPTRRRSSPTNPGGGSQRPSHGDGAIRQFNQGWNQAPACSIRAGLGHPFYPGSAARVVIGPDIVNLIATYNSQGETQPPRGTEGDHSDVSPGVLRHPRGTFTHPIKNFTRPPSPRGELGRMVGGI